MVYLHCTCINCYLVNQSSAGVGFFGGGLITRLILISNNMQYFVYSPNHQPVRFFNCFDVPFPSQQYHPTLINFLKFLQTKLLLFHRLSLDPSLPASKRGLYLFEHASRAAFDSDQPPTSVRHTPTAGFQEHVGDLGSLFVSGEHCSTAHTLTLSAFWVLRLHSEFGDSTLTSCVSGEQSSTTHSLTDTQFLVGPSHPPSPCVSTPTAGSIPSSKSVFSPAFIDTNRQGNSSGASHPLWHPLLSTAIPGSTKIKIQTSYGSWIIPCSRVKKTCLHSVRAVKGEPNEGIGGGFRGQSWDPGLEIEVPYEQRPVNEYSSLKDETLYSWGELSPTSFLLRLGGLWLVTFTVLGVPIAAASFNPSKEPLRFVLAAGIGTLFLVSLIVLRIYLGWSYVGDRLLSAVVPYEESGWYDGQMWVKPPEVLARDRLLGSYKVKPVIKLLKQTLVGTGALLVTGVMIFIFATPVEDFVKSTFVSKQNTSNLSASKINTKFDIRKEQLLRLPMEIMQDDDLAAAAAEAAEGRPVYCRDRFYRALAGGQYCKWDDLLR